jgi:hypothetical protein
MMVGLLGGLAPFDAAAQFPSQGNPPPQQGGFPSQGNSTPPRQGGFPSQGGVAPARGGSFQSQVFGFSLSWGPDWEVVGQDSGDGFDLIQLSNGTSVLSIGGGTTTGTPQDNVMQLAAAIDPGLQFVQPLIDEPERAAAVFELQSEGIGFVIDIGSLSANSGLMIVWQFPLGQYDAELDGVLEVINTIIV